MKRGFVPVLALLVMAASATSAQAVPHSSAQGLSHRNVCGVPAEGSASCLSKVVTNSNGSTFRGNPDAITATPAGWGPADLQSAYKLPAFTSRPTGAIGAAHDDPNAESNLGTYRTQYGLSACTTANGCFKKVIQSGSAGPYPA